MTKNIAAALAAFQSEHCGAVRDSRGNYGGYTSLAGVLQAIQPACAHGLSHSQTFAPEGEVMLVRTTLFHTSGETLVSEIPIKIPGSDGRAMQQLGSAITYARRYALQSLYGLAATDDDGESASPPAAARKPSKAPAKAPAPSAALGPTDDIKIPPEERDDLIDRIAKMPPAIRSAVIDSFRETYGIAKGEKIASHITSGEHSVFLNLKLEELGV